jgi:hypothetical protein
LLFSFEKMRSLVATIVAFAVFAATSLAQDSNQTAPFSLRLVSKNETLNGASLVACHEGAAVEGICVDFSRTSSETFAFNYTDYSLPYGTLVWNFTFTGEDGLASLWVPAALAFNLASNVAIPLFQPGYGNDEWTFDNHDLLLLGSYIDDTKAPGQQATGQKSYNRWYICDTYYGYAYTTLSWQLGRSPPQNPTCQKVDVKRVYHRS